MKKVVILFISALFIFLLGYGFMEYNRANKNVRNIRPLYSITSNDLYDEFSINESQATEKYKGKIIEVSGKVEEVVLNNGAQTIVLTGPDYPLGGVTCSMEEINSNVKVGEIIQIKGECQGMLLQVIINRAVIQKK